MSRLPQVSKNCVENTANRANTPLQHSHKSKSAGGWTRGAFFESEAYIYIYIYVGNLDLLGMIGERLAATWLQGFQSQPVHSWYRMSHHPHNSGAGACMFNTLD